jgi:Anti-sigma regulatory factor (Ser/Thr protein kinase)
MAESGVDLAEKCAIWALPADDTCAGVARRLLRHALQDMGLPDDQIYDATLAVNELAANAYKHVFSRPRPLAAAHSAPTRSPGTPELWVYRRGRNDRSQLVCKVFDPRREPIGHVPAQLTPANDLQEHGRGLTIVKSLTAAWGCHLTRSRFGGPWSAPGKATWFAIPLPPRAPRPPARVTPPQAARMLRTMLAARGIPTTVSDNWGRATLSMHDTLTVHCHDDAFTWTINGAPTRYAFYDITETVEQLVRLYEELHADPALCPPSP